MSLPNSSVRTGSYPSAVNLKHLQAASVVLEAVDTSAQKPVLWRHGWWDVVPGQ